MRICIIATGRCGSSSLFNCIKEHLTDDYTFLIEPLDPYHKTEEDLSSYDNTNNILIKMLLGQTPLKKNRKNAMLFYESIFKTFDKVIILDRKNKVEQSESFAYHTVNKTKDKHDTKRIYNLDFISKDMLNEWQLDLIVASDLLEVISVNNNKKIYYYEDIFVDKNISIVNEIFHYLELKPIEKVINDWILLDNKKVRITNIL